MAGKKSTKQKTTRALGKAGVSVGKRRADKTPRPVMVIVHGGGNIPKDYWKGLVQATQTQLGEPFDFIPAFYSDIITVRATGIAATLPEPPEVKRFRAEYEKQLRAAHEQNQKEKSQRGIASFAGINIDGAIVDTIEEVIAYVFNLNTAPQIRERVRATLDQAAEEFDEIVLVSHSLGTVVAFDILSQDADKYKIAQWFTLGCPLAKLVKTRVREADLGAIKTQNVARWWNVYDTNDFVADVIGAYFHREDFRVHDIFVEVAPTMPAAHDYLANQETQIMLADAMRQR